MRATLLLPRHVVARHEQGATEQVGRAVSDAVMYGVQQVVQGRRLPAVSQQRTAARVGGKHQ